MAIEQSKQPCTDESSPQQTLAYDLVNALWSLLMPCIHLEAIETVRHPAARQCDECVKMGSRWVHLRTCQTCGGTRCCDSSPNRHASRHAQSSGHPVIASAEEGERWLYCYPDDDFVEY